MLSFRKTKRFIFSRKRIRFGKIGRGRGGVLKKGGITYSDTNEPFSVLSFSECLVCVCVFCLFTPFLSVLFLFYRKNLVLQHLINRYMTFLIFE